MIKPDFQNDIKSSIVVFLVALPLCLGIALASGAPIASGLIAGVIGGIIVGLISNSQISVSGPAAGLSVIVASGISQLGGFENFSLAVMLAGIIQLLFAFIKAGAIGDYFPTSVIKGMLAAIGLILIIKQLPNALGISKGSSIADIHLGTALISIVSLGIMLLWEKIASTGKTFFKLVPGPLVAVIVSVVINNFFELISIEGLVHLPNKIFSSFTLPSLSNFNLNVAVISMTIAIVASLETLLCIDASDKIDPLKRKTNKNTELLAQGLGNTLSGLFGGLPITAVIVRTSANVNAGAKTKYSAIFHGFWLILCILLIPNFLNLIPLATLACILLLVGYKLTKPSLFIEMKQRGWEHLFILCTTIGAILATDLLKGIFIGLAVAILFDLKKPALRCVEVIHELDIVHFKFNNNVSFLHKPKIMKLLNSFDEKKEIHIHGIKLVRVHTDVHEMIQDFHAEALKSNRTIIIK